MNINVPAAPTLDVRSRQLERTSGWGIGRLRVPRPALSTAYDGAFRRIVEQINLALPDTGGHVIVMTNADAGDPPGNIAWWLAVSLANSDFGEILYLDADADTADPAFADAPGLLDLARRDGSLDLACGKTTVANLWTMPLRSARQPGAAQIADAQVRDALAMLRQRFGYVVTPARSPVSSPRTLVFVRHGDGVFMVVKARRTDREQAAQATGLVRQTGGRIIGAIMSQGGTP